MCDYALCLRELLSDAVELSDVIIGGPDIMVEIDETKLCIVKYHKCNCVEVICVLAVIDRSSEKNALWYKSLIDPCTQYVAC